MKSELNIRLITLVAITLFVGLFRVLSHVEGIQFLGNFSPIGALALFGGHYFQDRRKAQLLPILSLLISDVLMMRIFYAEYSNGLLYNGWYWTYGAFILMVFVGEKIKKVNFKNILIGSLVAAFTHWLVTDLGVWLGGGLDIGTGLPYTRDWSGLWRCYLLAIPFMKSLFMGNLVFGIILFGGFELAQNLVPSLKLETNKI